MKKSTNSPVTRSLDALDRLILRAWRVFKSLKFGIFLLATIGVVAIWGTMGFASNAALGDNSIPMARTLVFEHPYFVALLLLFALNLIVSTWHVTKMSWQIWFKKDFRRSPDYYDRCSTPAATVDIPGGPQEAERLLSRAFTQTHRDGNAFFAHRGLLARVGPTIVHIGILTVIGATVAKAVLLWSGLIVTEGRFVAAEGEEYSFIFEPVALEQQITQENRRVTPLDVWIRVLDFDEVKFPNSDVPAHFRSLVEVRDPETQQVTLAQLDMNHSLRVRSEKYGTLKFHQAGYNPTGPGEVQRVNFDVRHRKINERIAVTDAQPGDRVRVDETDLFLEVDGTSPGERWRLYSIENPKQPVAEGLLEGGQKLQFSFKPVEFYPDFRIDPETSEPTNASNIPRNPALKTDILMDGRSVRTTWLFFDPELAEMMPDAHPRYRLRMADVRVPPQADLAALDWNEPGTAVFDISINDLSGEDPLTTETLSIGEASSPRVYTSKIDHAGVDLGTEGDYRVAIIGPADRFVTVLSVVSDPSTFYIKLGVGIILLGAMMTFLSRYQSLYGLFDEETGTLRLTLVPRWGNTPPQEDFGRLIAFITSGGDKNAYKAPQSGANDANPRTA